MLEISYKDIHVLFFHQMYSGKEFLCNLRMMV